MSQPRLRARRRWPIVPVTTGTATLSAFGVIYGSGQTTALTRLCVGLCHQHGVRSPRTCGQFFTGGLVSHQKVPCRRQRHPAGAVEETVAAAFGHAATQTVYASGTVSFVFNRNVVGSAPVDARGVATLFEGRRVAADLCQARARRDNCDVYGAAEVLPRNFEGIVWVESGDGDCNQRAQSTDAQAAHVLINATGAGWMLAPPSDAAHGGLCSHGGDRNVSCQHVLGLRVQCLRLLGGERLYWRRQRG